MQLLAPRRVGPKKKGDGTLTVVDCRVESSIEFIIHSIPRWHGACLDDDAPRGVMSQLPVAGGSSNFFNFSCVSSQNGLKLSSCPLSMWCVCSFFRCCHRTFSVAILSF